MTYEPMMNEIIKKKKLSHYVCTFSNMIISPMEDENLIHNILTFTI